MSTPRKGKGRTQPKETATKCKSYSHRGQFRHLLFAVQKYHSKKNGRKMFNCLCSASCREDNFEAAEPLLAQLAGVVVDELGSRRD